MKLGLGLEAYQKGYWQERYWKAVYNYGEVNRQNDTLRRDNKQLTEINQTQAARLMEVELMLSCLTRVGEGIIVEHTKLMTLVKLFPDTLKFIKRINSRYAKD